MPRAGRSTASPTAIQVRGRSRVRGSKPTCTSASTDAGALTANLLAQPTYQTGKPSDVEGLSKDAATVVGPLGACSFAHQLAVSQAISVGGDPKASTVIQSAISAALRASTLTFGPNKVSTFSIGSAPKAAVRPVLEAVLGKPTEVRVLQCPPTGSPWTRVSWGGVSVAFNDGQAGSPLGEWSIAASGSRPGNVEVAGGWPIKTTLAELQSRSPGVVLEPTMVLSVAEPQKGLYYLWATPTGTNHSVAGGRWAFCDA